jgi:hypothetical protein
MIRTSRSERSSDYYTKTQWWSCQICGENEEASQEIPEPTEQTMLIKRLLRLGSDYDIKSFQLEVKGSEVTAKAVFYPFDTAKVRRIIYKAEDTDFITAHDLMELDKARIRKRVDREKFLTRPLRYNVAQLVETRIIFQQRSIITLIQNWL